MEDKKALKPMLLLYQELFGRGTLTSFTTDKSYYTNDNRLTIAIDNGEEIGLQQPGFKDSLPEDIRKEVK